MTKLDAYVEQLKRLFPPGRAFNREADTVFHKFLEGWSEELVRIDDQAEKMLKEVDPRTTNELAPEWEEFLALPDDCSDPGELTIEERQAQITAKFLNPGGQDTEFFEQLIQNLGFTVEIGKFEDDTMVAEHIGDVGDRWTYFWPIYIGSDERSLVLECLVKRATHTHIIPVFIYDGGPTIFAYRQKYIAMEDGFDLLKEDGGFLYTEGYKYYVKS